MRIFITSFRSFEINNNSFVCFYLRVRGWSGGAMVLGKLPVRGVLLIWIRVGQGPTALAVGAGGGCLDIFSLVYHFSFLSPSFWETARYRLKYCLKGPLNPKQQHYLRVMKFSNNYVIFRRRRNTITQSLLWIRKDTDRLPSGRHTS